jgi:acyl transferase domain-containing protein/acyl carrier protein
MTHSADLDLDGIAIVGMSGRFPGADDLGQFWANLRDGVESISRFTEADLAEAGIPPAMAQQPGFVNAGGVLHDAELFDASFFGFSAREAEVLDPQQRVFIECAWHAVEDAGYDPHAYPGAIGVFAGAAMSSYLFNILSNQEVMGLVGPYQVLLGNDKDHLATHVSYKLDLKGPALTVQTACSTSLVAVCLACQSLLDGQCDMALAGGVSIKVPQKTGYVYQEGMINSPDGHCRPFDASARGTVGGNGVGIVVLKRLADARDDRDHIRAVIRGSAVNNDGSLKVGYTAPSVEGQAEVVATAQAMAGVSPDTISYVETHGTATALGDPVEIAALTQAFRAGTARRGFCAIGSVKSNIGHLDPASGIAGLIKTALMLEHQWLPPSLHYSIPNPQIDFAGSPFYVNTTSQAWGAPDGPRRAGVSSFGIGGTNAHVVLEEGPEPDGAPGRSGQLVVLSARSGPALDAVAAKLVDHLRRAPAANLADVCYTAQVGRRQFDHRLMVAADSREDAIAALEAPDGGRVQRAVRTGDRDHVVFMFSGQGSQYVNMGRDLYEREETFRTWMDHCASSLAPLLGLDLRSLLYPDGDGGEAADRRLTQTEYAQPALFAVEYALAQLWIEWGVRPAAMIGHSIGEYVAACLAGVFSLDDALELVAARGHLMHLMPAGAMLAVTAPPPEIETLLGDDVDLAAINAPSQCVVSGPTAAIAALEERLAAAGLPARRLQTSHAFHSRTMDPVLAPFREAVSRIELKPPSIPFSSNVSGGWITAEAATDPAYWAHHLRQPVRFGDGLAMALERPGALLVEVGPGGVLSGLARSHPARSDTQLVLQSVRRPHESESDVLFVLRALGQLWLAGVAVDWKGLHAHERRRRVPLPTYPFERQRYWISPRDTSAAIAAAPARAARAEPSLPRPPVDEWFSRPVWKLRPAPAGADASSPLTTVRRWLVVGDSSLLTRRAVAVLERSGCEIRLVEAAAGFEQHDERGFAIDPRDQSHYEALLHELHASDWVPERILHLWNTSRDQPAEQSPASFDEAQLAGFYSLLFLAQALAASNWASRVKIGVVTSFLHDVTGDEPIRPELATLSSACKIVPQELSNVRCQTIDLEIPDDPSAIDELVTSALADVAADGGDTVVAYRGGDRWVQAYEPIRPHSADRSRSLLRDRGVYLITGGLGNLGLLMAEELAARVGARLVLVGRSPFPVRESWESWLASHEDHDSMSHTIRRLQAAEEENGAEIMIRNANVADESEMQRVVDDAVARFGGLDGVVHAAGVTSPDGFAFIARTDRSLCERHFLAKAHGLLVLERLLRGAELDFWLLFSSLSTVLGGLGFAGYAASNSFMDAFAASQNRQGSTPWITVDWDGWDLRPPHPAYATSDGASSGIRPEEGIEAFRRIVTEPSERHVVVSVENLESRLRKWIELEPVSATTAGEPTSPLHSRPDLTSPYAAPRRDIEHAIAGTWQELLGVEPVGIHDNFFELGGDSLLAIQLTSRLRDTLGAEVSIQSLFDAPTIASLVAGLESPGSGQPAAATDDDQTARILELVEQLSDREVEALLAESGPAAEEGGWTS